MVSGVAEEDDVRSIRIWSSLEDFGYRTCSVSMFFSNFFKPTAFTSLHK